MVFLWNCFSKKVTNINLLTFRVCHQLLFLYFTVINISLNNIDLAYLSFLLTMWFGNSISKFLLQWWILYEWSLNRRATVTSIFIFQLSILQEYLKLMHFLSSFVLTIRFIFLIFNFVVDLANEFNTLYRYNCYCFGSRAYWCPLIFVITEMGFGYSAPSFY